MRKIINETYVTLDGVIAPLDFTASFSGGEERERYVRDVLFEADALLLGRATYEAFDSVWPKLTAADDNPGSEGFNDRINSMPKFVASSTLKEPLAWNNATLLKGDVVQAVAKLKQQSGQNILMYGCGPLAHTLLQHGLMDEFRFWVYPVVAGGGTRMFGEGNQAMLKLVASRPFPSGVVVYSYRPVKAGAESGESTLTKTSRTRTIDIAALDAYRHANGG
ncbi:MAG: dihydrofolate reductase family protein [Anaerolineales bacterium]